MQKRTESIEAFYEGVSYTVEGSCPYIYSYNSKTLRYDLESHIIYKKNKKSLEGQDTILLKRPSNQIIISEVDQEISFINQLYILEKSKTGFVKYFSQNNKLSKNDSTYLKIKQGDKIKLIFENLIVNNENQYFLVALGYYQPLGRLFKPPEYLSLNATDIK